MSEKTKTDPNAVTKPSPGKRFECAHCTADVTDYGPSGRVLANGSGYQCPTCHGFTCQRCAGSWC